MSAGDDRQDLIDQALRNVELLQRARQMLGDDLEVLLRQVHVLVRLAEILARIVVGPAESHGQESFLLRRLPFHVDGIEEPARRRIRQDLSIEYVHGRVNGLVAAELIVKRGHRRLLAGFLTRHRERRSSTAGRGAPRPGARLVVSSSHPQALTRRPTGKRTL